ncbi:hypothetical protein RRF57_012638 [Xylaria bambusicola]|uniref:Rhodopsin domain-containing protein n=1 Tax=Xylaria bambusicola TaxID=326684 RepID=A0AAN7V0S8_9PEZI
MAIKGGGVSVVATMWSLTGLTTLFLLLRLYTRLIVLRAYGGDDHVYILAYICLLLMTTFYTKSATLGLGQTNAEIGNPDRIVEAILWEAIGQTFTVLGTAIAKWSLGLFLLRLVKVRWQIIVIWTAMSGLLAASISVLFAFWLQVQTFRILMGPTNPRRVLSYQCSPSINGAQQYASALISLVEDPHLVSTVVVDLLFVVLPWVFIWSLRINKHEKIVILSSMSLGVLAAASGIQRALEIGGLSSPEYLRDTVGLLIWSSVEQSVTMICICIPVCRPLFKIIIRRIMPRNSGSITGSSGDRGFRLSGLGRDGSGQKQLTIGSTGKKRPNLYDLTTTNEEGTTFATECYANGLPTVNGSDEQVLLHSNNTGNNQPAGHTLVAQGIRVTDEYVVTRTS